MNQSTKRFIFFKELSISFLHACMFPAFGFTLKHTQQSKTTKTVG